MNHRKSIWNPLQRIASIALLLCLVFQLGTCPCGCIEHNAWAHLLGIQPDDHGDQTSRTGAPGVNVAGDDHDCTGEGRPQYINNARSVSTPASSVQSISDLPLASANAQLKLVLVSNELQSTPSHGEPHALSLPALQVFRL